MWCSCMPQDNIRIRGAREHNLKNIDVTIPRDKLVVITGLSGSGKSSLAFDTIFAEGQRRYVESLSTYARQFLDKMEKPDVDHIDGLSPALSIDQKGTTHNPRSTVGTITEMYDYLRLLYARIGHLHCPKCRREVSQQTVQQIVDAVLNLPEGSRIMLLAPLVTKREDEYEHLLNEMRRSGYVRVRVDGTIYDLSDEIELDKQKKQTIEVVVDRLMIPTGQQQSPIGHTPRSNPVTYTDAFTGIRELFAQVPEARLRGYKPRRFSLNVKGGRCEACQGEGIVKIEMNFLPDVYVPCEVCRGKRYNREALDIHYKGKNIADVLDMTVEEAMGFFAKVPSIYQKLKTLYDVGLDYMRLGQPATTLSGGEAQRVKLAAELARRATGRTMYILDEPTTGLHFADVERLLHVLQCLVDAGNSIVVIEHNMEVVKSADWIIDLGPEGGDAGGQVIAQGTPEDVAENEQSLTGYYLRRMLTEEAAWATTRQSSEIVAA